MYRDVIIAGFGGQGVLLAGNLLAQAGMESGLEVTFIPVYGAEMRAALPRPGRLVHTDSGADRTSPATMGDNHQKKPGLMTHISQPHTRPRAVPHQWKRRASPQLVPLSSRFWAFHDTRQPSRVLTLSLIHI